MPAAPSRPPAPSPPRALTGAFSGRQIRYWTADRASFTSDRDTTTAASTGPRPGTIASAPLDPVGSESSAEAGHHAHNSAAANPNARMPIAAREYQDTSFPFRVDRPSTR